MRSFIRHSLQNRHLVSLITQVSGALVGMATFVLLARHVSASAFGEWLVYVSGFVLLDMVRTGFVQTALIRFAASAETKEKQAYVGSAWVLGLSLTVLLALLVAGISLLLPESRAGSFALLLDWYPMLAFATLPLHVAYWVQQTDQRFDRIWMLRMTASVPFLLAVSISLFGEPQAISKIALLHVLCQLLASVVALMTGWAAFSCLMQTNQKALGQMAGFGRYSVGTLLGTNLLKSSDTFLIASLLSPVAVALYGVAQKLVDAIELPLRAFGAVALPSLAQLIHKGNLDAANRAFHQAVGALTLLVLPVAVVTFVWAPQLILLIGGAGYEDAAVLLRIFAIYTLLLPADRYLGILLDSLGHPKLNVIKVSSMVFANVVGDLIALLLFESLVAVAIATITTHLTGVVLGFRFANRFTPVSASAMVKEGGQHLYRLLKRGHTFYRTHRYAPLS